MPGQIFIHNNLWIFLAPLSLLMLIVIVIILFISIIIFLIDVCVCLLCVWDLAVSFNCVGFSSQPLYPLNHHIGHLITFVKTIFVSLFTVRFNYDIFTWVCLYIFFSFIPSPIAFFICPASSWHPLFSSQWVPPAVFMSFVFYCIL